MVPRTSSTDSGVWTTLAVTLRLVIPEMFLGWMALHTHELRVLKLMGEATIPMLEEPITRAMIAKLGGGVKDADLTNYRPRSAL